MAFFSEKCLHDELVERLNVWKTGIRSRRVLKCLAAITGLRENHQASVSAKNNGPYWIAFKFIFFFQKQSTILTFHRDNHNGCNLMSKARHHSPAFFYVESCARMCALKVKKWNSSHMFCSTFCHKSRRRKTFAFHLQFPEGKLWNMQTENLQFAISVPFWWTILKLRVFNDRSIFVQKTRTTAEWQYKAFLSRQGATEKTRGNGFWQYRKIGNSKNGN